MLGKSLECENSREINICKLLAIFRMLEFGANTDEMTFK